MWLIVLLQFIAIISVNNAEERIIGGLLATDTVPYQVSLKNAEGEHFCGASIIYRNIIITAAHCLISIKSLNDVVAVVGTNFLNRLGTRHKIAGILIHKDYNTTTSQNDIGLLRTVYPIEYNENVQPIKLFTGEVPDESEMLLSGWGRTTNIGKRPTNFLRVLTVYAVNNKQCEEWLDDSRARLHVYSTDICTFKTIKQGTCSGDSGGPLAYNGQLAGIVSRGFPCARGLPDVFTKISAYIPWIDRNVQKIRRHNPKM